MIFTTHLVSWLKNAKLSKSQQIISIHKSLKSKDLSFGLSYNTYYLKWFWNGDLGRFVRVFLWGIFWVNCSHAWGSVKGGIDETEFRRLIVPTIVVADNTPKGQRKVIAFGKSLKIGFFEMSRTSDEKALAWSQVGKRKGTKAGSEAFQFTSFSYLQIPFISDPRSGKFSGIGNLDITPEGPLVDRLQKMIFDNFGFSSRVNISPDLFFGSFLGVLDTFTHQPRLPYYCYSSKSQYNQSHQTDLVREGPTFHLGAFLYVLWAMGGAGMLIFLGPPLLANRKWWLGWGSIVAGCLIIAGWFAY